MAKLQRDLIDKFGLPGNKIYGMSCSKLERLQKKIRQIIKEKYRSHRRERLLGTKTKAIPEDIFQQVLTYFKKVDPELALIYEVQGIEGQRISDVLNMKIQDLNFKDHIISIYNQKSNRWYDLPLDQKVEMDLSKWVKNNKFEIENHNNFIFFTRDDEHHPRRKTDHLTQQYVNRRFVLFLDSRGLNKVYARRKGDGGKLHLYTTHSDRGHAATRIKNITGSREAAAKLLDHSPRSGDSTDLYFERSDDDLFKAMRKK
ncbi:MAG: tyrosine-type recombinase/integrase [Nanoarchaeota archaeon]|nr:tyrosine-type recombinase/integrase [Nanoarchaeota archaeon]